MKIFFFMLTLCAFFLACTGNPNQNKVNTSIGRKKNDSLESVSHDLVRKYGEQWDFCHCVKVGDSIDKALKSRQLSQSEFEELSNRFDEVEQKCKGFRLEDPNRTPDDRLAHKSKVKKCLENTVN